MVPSIFYNPNYSATDNMVYSINEDSTITEFDVNYTHYSSKYGFQLADRTQHGLHVLAAAATFGKEALMEHIIYLGGKDLMGLKDLSGLTALRYAVHDVHKAATKMLLKYGAQLNEHFTPAQWAFVTRVQQELIEEQRAIEGQVNAALQLPPGIANLISSYLYMVDNKHTNRRIGFN